MWFGSQCFGCYLSIFDFLFSKVRGGVEGNFVISKVGIRADRNFAISKGRHVWVDFPFSKVSRGSGGISQLGSD